MKYKADSHGMCPDIISVMSTVALGLIAISGLLLCRVTFTFHMMPYILRETAIQRSPLAMFKATSFSHFHCLSATGRQLLILSLSRTFFSSAHLTPTGKREEQEIPCGSACPHSDANPTPSAFLPQREVVCDAFLSMGATR